jgi:dTDP-4-amino-4,6-dideoxygalactose transaminase
VHAPVAARTLWHAVPDAWWPARARAAQAAALCLLQDAYPGHCATLLSSGTAALQLAVTLAHPGPGAPRVAVPAYACPDLGTAVQGAGGTLLLYDTDPATLAPDLASVERALRAGATVVVVAHLFGVVTALGPVEALAAAHGAVVVEDAAQHAGGTVDGVRGGGQGAWGVLSFGRGKGLNAGGGGVLLSRTPLPPRWAEAVAAAPRGSSVRHLLVTAATAALAHPLPFAVVRRLPGVGVGATTYQAPTPPARPPATMARLLHAAWQAEPAARANRQRRQAAYRAALAAVPGVTGVTLPAGGTPGALREPVLAHPARMAPLAPLGVGRGYPRTLAAYAELAGSLAAPPDPLPGADHLVAQLHTLPTHPLVSEAAAARLLAALGASAHVADAHGR